MGAQEVRELWGELGGGWELWGQLRNSEGERSFSHAHTPLQTSTEVFPKQPGLWDFRQWGVMEVSHKVAWAGEEDLQVSRNFHLCHFPFFFLNFTEV